MSCENWDLVVVVLCLNVSLSVLHYLLEKIKDKTKNNIDNKIFNIICFCEGVLKWVMANRR